MRTADAALGRGVGKALLDHLVATARDEGMTRLSLETGSTEQFAAAIRLYEREGFRALRAVRRLCRHALHPLLYQGNLGPLHPRGETAVRGIVGVDIGNCGSARSARIFSSASPGSAKSAFFSMPSGPNPLRPSGRPSNTGGSDPHRPPHVRSLTDVDRVGRTIRRRDIVACVMEQDQRFTSPGVLQADPAGEATVCSAVTRTALCAANSSSLRPMRWANCEGSRPEIL